MQREVCAAPDYKAMYFELFRASVQAAQLLQDAQKRAEQHLLEADPPPIRLEQTEQTDEELVFFGQRSSPLSHLRCHASPKGRAFAKPGTLPYCQSLPH